MLGESLHCYLAYLPAEVVLALLPLQLQRMTGLTFSERLNSILLWVQTASNSINDDWLLTAFKAQQTLFPFCPIPGRADEYSLIWHRVEVWANKPQGALAETQHPPNYHQPQARYSLMLSSHFQRSLGICTALSTKTHCASKKPLAFSECTCSIMSLDIQMKFCVKGPCRLCEVISALCGIFLFLGTSNAMWLKMHGFKMEFSFPTSPT